MVKKVNNQGSGATAVEYLSETQLAHLLHYVKSRADLAREKGTTRAIHDELITLLLVNTGVRPRELCDLNLGDLPAEHGESTVWVRGPDDSVARKVEIGPETVRCLERFVRLYRKGANADEPLFISERGNRLTYMSVYSKVRNVGEKAEIGRLHPRMLRRTYLIRLYSAERDLRFVQDQAGHASPKTTARYAKSNGNGGQEPAATPPAYSLPLDLNGNSPEGSEQISICEACGESISEGPGTIIDSGQILCADCLKYFRNK
jgi:integrase